LHYLDYIYPNDNYPEKESTLVKIKKKFSDVDPIKIENHLLYLVRKDWIEERHYCMNEGIGFVDYSIENKGSYYLVNKQNKSDNRLLDRLDRLINLTLDQLEKENLKKSFKTFSEKFTKLIPSKFSNLDKLNHQQIFVGSHYLEKKQLFSELLQLWKQIQQNLLPFSDSPKNLTKSLLKTKLKVFQKKIKKIRNSSNTN